MPAIKISSHLTVSVVKEATEDELFNQQDLNQRMDDAFVELTNQDSVLLKSAALDVSAYINDISKIIHALLNSEMAMGEEDKKQIEAIVQCILKLAELFDAIDPGYEQEEVHGILDNTRTKTRTITGCMQRVDIVHGEGHKLFSTYGLPKMFYYPPITSEEQRDVYIRDLSDTYGVNDLPALEVYNHLKEMDPEKFPDDLILHMLFTARKWYLAEAKARAINLKLLKKVFNNTDTIEGNET